jgi:nicotinamidase-related amidase
VAYDYCVYLTLLKLDNKWSNASARDAQELRYATYVIEDASRGTSYKRTIAAKKDMQAKGIHAIEIADLESILHWRQM